MWAKTSFDMQYILNKAVLQKATSSDIQHGRQPLPEFLKAIVVVCYYFLFPINSTKTICFFKYNLPIARAAFKALMQSKDVVGFKLTHYYFNCFHCQVSIQWDQHGANQRNSPL